MKIESEPWMRRRPFRIWLSSVSHSILLLRSTRPEDPDGSTRADVLFKCVCYLSMPTQIPSLKLSCASTSAAEIAKRVNLPMDLLEYQALFELDWDGGCGLVVASVAHVNEDQEEDFAPSAAFTLPSMVYDLPGTSDDHRLNILRLILYRYRRTMSENQVDKLVDEAISWLLPRAATDSLDWFEPDVAVLPGPLAECLLSDLSEVLTARHVGLIAALFLRVMRVDGVPLERVLFGQEYVNLSSGNLLLSSLMAYSSTVRADDVEHVVRHVAAEHTDRAAVSAWLLSAAMRDGARGALLSPEAARALSGHPNRLVREIARTLPARQA